MDAVSRAVNEKVPPSRDDIRQSQEMIVALRKRRLPQMVNWWDASVLTMVGVRTLISATIGNYADQRPMQAAADNVPEDELTSRHDYRNVMPGGVDENGAKAVYDDVRGAWTLETAGSLKTLKFDKDGALWVDFIADLGDGFEATYAMAYLMAQPQILADIPDADGKVQRKELPAGDILIFGGDLAYPNATIEEYTDRCLMPYDAAFRLKENEEPKRKLFFIAGNHDWYDGLAAFTSVFCTARDRLARGKGLKIGGWQSEQRRSYFALALPHGWWFWGVDLALNETIDEAQKNYFEAMSFKTNPGEKIVIILHAPVWQTNDKSPLHEVSQWARKRGAEVVALLAGDLHFYSRFHSVGRELADNKDDVLPRELQLITAGGGGAFLHPTYQLPRKMKVHWTVPKETSSLPRTAGVDYKDKVATITANDDLVFDKSKPFNFHAPHIYPSRALSMMLALKNLLLPFHNRKFALFMGLLYLVYAWVFQISILNPTDQIRRAHDVQVTVIKAQCEIEPTELREKCVEDNVAKLDEDSLSKRLQKVEQRLPAVTPNADGATVATVDGAAKTAGAPIEVVMSTEAYGPHQSLPYAGQKLIEVLQKTADYTGGTNVAHYLQSVLERVYDQGGVKSVAWRVIWSQINTGRLLYAMLNNPALLFMVVGLYWALIKYVGFDDREFIRPRWLKWPVKIVVGGAHAWVHMALLLSLNVVLQPFYVYFSQGNAGWPWILVGVICYSALLVLIGGVLGGMVFGLYWVLTSLIGRLHMDSFGALQIADYKNFLRMRIEKDQLTIFPIGLDKVPRRKRWRALTPDDDTSRHNPLIKPSTPLKPHLIEMPIVIKGPSARA